MGYGCTCCSRTILVELNLIMMGVGMAMVGLLLWIKFDNTFEYELRNIILNSYGYSQYKQSIQFGVILAWWVLIGFGAAAAIIGLFGTCGSCCNFRCLNAFYMIFLIILTALEVAVGIFIVFWRTYIYQVVYPYISQVFRDQQSQQEAQVLRNRFHCCGDGQASNMCNQYDVPCTTQIIHDMEVMFIIAGAVLIVIVFFQAISIILAGVVVCCGKSNKVQA